MALSLEALKALEIKNMRFAYSERDTMLYALSIGFGRDPLDLNELPFVYEGAGLKAIPTMAVVLASTGIIRKTGVDFTKVLHGEQRLTMHRPLPVSGEILAESRIAGIYDKGPGKGAVLLLETTARSAHDDAPLFTFVMTIVARGDGGFGGPQGSGPEPHRLPDRAPDRTEIFQTRPEAALLYRLNADRNPLHADPAVAARAGFARPILHGLATYGIACRRTLRSGRLRSRAASLLRCTLLRTRLSRRHDRDRHLDRRRHRVIPLSRAGARRCRSQQRAMRAESNSMISLTADDIAFGQEVAAFARDNLSVMLRRKVASELRPDKAELVAWQRTLYDRGWAAPGWPKEHGGTGWSLVRQYIFKREMGSALAPDPVPFGLQMIGPVLYKFGSAEQKAHYLPSILTGETWWCQGFSEPDAGSDLASLKTRAHLDGDAFVVTGQKIWTSLAQWADMMFCLVRSEDSAKPQAGISMLLIDMKSPGVTVRPIITLDGHHHLNEVFLDDVRVPTSNLVGDRGKGWNYAKYLLGHERVGIANIPRLRRRMNAMSQLISSPAPGATPSPDPSLRSEIAAFEADLIALEQAELRALARVMQQRPGPADASILKVTSTVLLQRSDGLLARMLGPGAAIMPTSQQRLASDVAAVHWGIIPALLHGRASTIYGGSTEIQRNIIAREALNAHAN